MLKDLDLSTLRQQLNDDGETVALEGAEAEAWSVRGVSPRLVCAPATAKGVAAALVHCDQAGAAVIPWGAGTQQGLGYPPREADVVITTRRLNRLLEHEPGDLTVTVETGMALDDLQRALGKHGQWLPLDPPLRAGATVGGVIATNVSGSRRIRDGGLRDLLIGTRVANVDGIVTRAGGRVVKNVTGYDLNKLQIGVLGTLGILVEATFKVAPRPETERSWAGRFASPQAAGRAMVKLLQKPLLPTALDILNHRAAAAAGLSVPPGHWVLLGRSSGFAPAVERHLAEFEAAAHAEGALETERLSEEVAANLWATWTDRTAGLRWAAQALTCRVAVPPAAVGQLCQEGAVVGRDATIWAHGTGGGFWSAPAEEIQKVTDLVAQLHALARELGGSMVVENWPASATGVEVWGPPGGPLSLMKAIKAQYDPHGILNPGRFVGGI